MSAFDIEKYLKTTVSSTSDSSNTQTTFDLSCWANALSSSEKNPQAGYPAERDSGTLESHSSSKTDDNRRNMTLANTSSSEVQFPNTATNGDDPKSSFPRPCASLTSSRQTLDCAQFPPLNSFAHKLTSKEETPALYSQSSGSTARTPTNTVAELGEVKPQKSLRSSDSFSKNDKSGARTSQSWRKSQSSLPALKASSPPTQRLRNGGQEVPGRPRDSPEKNLPATPLPQSSEPQAELSAERSRPSQDPLSGE